MKIAVRCIYWYPVTPNFVLADLEGEEWKSFSTQEKIQKKGLRV